MPNHALMTPPLAGQGVRTIGLLLAAASAAFAGAPYIPRSDNEVLETLPTEVLAQRDEVGALRDQLSADPDNGDLAATVARRYIQLGKSGGGPRFFGYARSAIAPWWDDAEAPIEVVKVRAKLLETDHNYHEALVNLERLLEREPRDMQAWIEAANINRVIGDYDAAWKASEQLGTFARGAPLLISRVPLLAATGKAEEAYGLLKTARIDAAKNLPTVVPWIVTMQAETARALGLDSEAESHYLEGLAAEPNDAYMKRAYADFLLDRGRNAEAVTLLRDDVSDNGVLLLAAIAAHRDGQTKLAQEWQGQLAGRFEETRLRGDLPHGRYEARFALELQDEPQRALELALANWGRQKETRDTRNVLEAAIAANDPTAAGPALAFLKQHGTQDVALEKLVRQLEDR